MTMASIMVMMIKMSDISKNVLRPARGRIMLAALIMMLSSISISAQEPASIHGDTLTLDFVTHQVLAHNDRAAAMRLMEDAAIKNIGPAGAWDDPMLMVGIQNLPTSLKFNEDEMTMKMVGISQNIPYAGEKGLRSRAAKARARVANADTRAMEIDLVTAARNAYLELYYRKQTLNLIRSQHELQQDIVASSAAKLTASLISQSDLSAAQADLWRLEADILNGEQEIDAANNQLYSLMGREKPDNLPTLVTPEVEIPPTIETWFDLAKENYPSLKKAQGQAESYRFSAVAARRMRWPMLGLSASYGFRSGSTTDPMTGDVMIWGDMVSFQANISLPIFSGRQQGKMALSMEAMRKSSESEASQIWRDTQAELRSFYSRSQRLTQSLNLYRERIIPADEDAYKSAFAGYAANKVPLSNLLNIAMNIYRDRQNANQVEYQLSQTLIEAGRYIINTDDWK